MRVVEAPTASETHGRRSVGFAPEGRAPVRVGLRAWDLVVPLGDDVETAWQALLDGAFVKNHAKCGAAPHAIGLAQRVVARVKRRAHIDADAAVVVGTSKGSVENWLDTAGAVARRQVGLGDIAAGVAEALGFQGPRLTVSAACASGLHALIRGAMMIESGEVRQVMVVAAEASVLPLFLGSFQRLGVLAKPGTGCRPFDCNRDGFFMSEAAAAVLLEASHANESPRTAVRGSHDAPTPAPAPLHLDRYALAGDATHLTGGDPDAAALRHVLARVLDDRPVDLIHAHGTGTALNDEAELRAIESLLPDDPDKPVLYSHKGALGHSLGAAGLVSVVLNCQAHAKGVVPPNVQTRDPLPTRRVRLSSERTDRDVKRSVALAAGFGGAVAAVSLVSE
jgi:3-oxoacyl-[acyl-carrier-protein] synthase II